MSELILNVLRADPLERERWAKEWLRAEAERLRDIIARNQDTPQRIPVEVQAEIKDFLDHLDEFIAVLLITTVKEEYQEDFADFISAIEEVKKHLPQKGAPNPVAGMLGR